MKPSSHRLPPAARRTLALLSLAGGLLFHGSSAVAVGFGNIVVHSALGRPLHAEIEILRPTEEIVAEGCYRIARDRLNDAEIPRVDRGKLDLRKADDGRYWLVLTTSAAIREPLMAVALRIGCGTELVREFTMIFSPPEQTPAVVAAARPAPAAVVESPRRARVDGEMRTPRSMARALYPDSRRLQRRFVDELIVANPDLELFADTPLPADVVLTLPDMRPLPPAPRAALPPPAAPAAAPAVARPPPDPGNARPVRRGEQLQIADRLRIGADPDIGRDGGEPVLRLSTELSGHAADLANGASNRELLRFEFRRLLDAEERPWADAAADSPGHRERLRQSAADFRHFAELLDKMSQPVTAAPAAAETPPPVVAAPAVVAAPVRPAERQAPAGSGLAGTVLPLLAGALAVAIVVWFLVRHRRQAPGEAESLQPEVDADPTDIFAGRATPAASPPVPQDAVPAAPAQALAVQKPLPQATPVPPAAPASVPAAPAVVTPTLLARVADTASVAADTSELAAMAPSLAAAAEPASAAVPAPEDVTAPAIPVVPAEIAFELPDTAAPGVTPRTLAAVVHEIGLDAEAGALSAGRGLASGTAGLPDGAGDVVEVAEVMVSFGRNDEAVEMLADFIRKYPRASLQAWLRLLDLYAAEGRMLDFEALAPRLNQNFNVEAPTWSEATAELQPSLRQLADFPHIRCGVESTWGTEACLRYLYKLINDNRGGSRNGFSRFVAEEIVFLAAVLEERLRQQTEKDSVLEFTT